MKIAIAMIVVGAGFYLWSNTTASSNSPTTASLAGILTPTVCLLLVAGGAGLALYEKGVL
ncbi:MAG TPA: hypothetical protein VGY31_03475 [Terriglobia bacterium]|nr:hypothetical protein [Terriglobia bacterium]